MPARTLTILVGICCYLAFSLPQAVISSTHAKLPNTKKLIRHLSINTCAD